MRLFTKARIQTGGERADRISSVRSVWLVPDGKPRARLQRHPPFSLLSCCLRCRKHRTSREDVTIRTNISGMFRKPLPPKMERTFRSWHGAHPEISQCHIYFRVEIRLPIVPLGVWYVKIYLDKINLDTQYIPSYRNVPKLCHFLCAFL